MPRKRRRARGEGSIYPVPGGWMAEVQLPNGKTARRRAKSEQDALAKRNRLLSDLGRGINLRIKPQTLAAWLTEWQAEKLDHVQPATRTSYESIVRLHISGTALARTRLDTLTRADVQAWASALAAAKGASTAKKVLRCLHAALTVALDDERISHNPAQRIKLKAASSRAIAPWNLAQTRQFLDAVADHRLGVLFRLALNLGLRIGELAGLTWECFDADAGTLTVKQQLQRIDGALTLKSPKSASSCRVVPLDADLVALLQRQRARGAAEQLRLGPKWHGRSEQGGFIFTTRTGAPLSPTAVRQQFATAVRRAGVPVCCFHDTRHTAATLLLMAGVPLVTVSKLLGHSSVAITARVYAHALDDSKATAIAGLSAALRRAQ